MFITFREKVACSVMYYKKTILQKDMFAKSYHIVNVCVLVAI